MMDNIILDVANRIRGLREILDISEEEMAQVTETTPEQYRIMEEGNTDFNFTFIFKCAQRFGVEVADILKGSSPTLTSYSVTRKGEGLPIARRGGFVYNNLAPMFKHKLVEPFWVKAPYTPGNEESEIETATHEGQEFDIIIKGHLKVIVDGNVELLGPGDTIFYDSAYPHGMVAVGGEDCEFNAIVINPRGRYEYQASAMQQPRRSDYQRGVEKPVADRFIQTKTDENGVLTAVNFKNEVRFNFVYDVVDALAEKSPDKLAMLHVDKDFVERRFSFADIRAYSSRAANYFRSLGIKKGDRVMLVLKRHYQFWFAILGLHRLGAVAIPATNQLLEKDLLYRFESAGISAIVCTPDDGTAEQVERAASHYAGLTTKIIVGGPREGWFDFDHDFMEMSPAFPRPSGPDNSGGNDMMLMFFSSGTAGYPKIVAHSFTYALGHYVTARYWQNVSPDGLHFTISDTGWGKAMWGKLYGQWLCEAAFFVYDFDRFNSHNILSMFAKYHITTFCAPPTMYRFFIKEDLSKYDLSSLEYAATAGEALNPEVFHRFYEATGLKIKEGFGQTETTLTVCNLVGMPIKIGAMGKPSPQYDVDIVRPDGSPTDIGEIGEIVIRTDKRTACGLFLGYFRDDTTTRDAWHDHLYHTGDTAWRDEDGYFWYVGRTDDVIKSSGYRIGPFEIESVIMELPYVLECAVVAAPDPIRGQIVKAVVVLNKGTEPTDELKKDIQQYVKTHTAPYKYPRQVEFINALPKTVNGKIRRAALRQNGEQNTRDLDN